MNYNKEKEKVEPEINKLKAELEIVKKRIGRAKELLMKELEVKNYDEI